MTEKMKLEDLRFKGGWTFVTPAIVLALSEMKYRKILIPIAKPMV